MEGEGSNVSTSAESTFTEDEIFSDEVVIDLPEGVEIVGLSEEEPEEYVLNEELIELAMTKFTSASYRSPAQLSITIGPDEDFQMMAYPLKICEAKKIIGERNFFAIKRKSRVKKAFDSGRRFILEHKLKKNQFMPRVNTDPQYHESAHYHGNNHCPISAVPIPNMNIEYPKKPKWNLNGTSRSQSAESVTRTSTEASGNSKMLFKASMLAGNFKKKPVSSASSSSLDSQSTHGTHTSI